MFVRPYYVPILTGKVGEFNALYGLRRRLALINALTPYVDMPPITRPRPDVPGRKPDPPIDPPKTLGILLDRVQGTWTQPRRVIVDLAAYDRYEVEGRHPLLWLVEEAEQRDVWLMGGISTKSSDKYRQAVEDASSRLSGLCVRVHVPPDPEVAAVVSAARDLIDALPPPAIGLREIMVDFERIEEHDVGRGALPALCVHVMRALKKAGYDTTAVASSCVPKDPPEPIDPDNPRPKRYMRRDWRLWQALADESLAAGTAFADYGITGPRRDDDKWVPGPAPYLRYTTESALLIWRGYMGEAKDRRQIDFRELCKAQVDHRDFQNLSLGDRAIMAAAARSGDAETKGRGTATQWIEYATSHHVAHITKAIAKLNQ
jgi:hypothetical protein